MTKALHLFRHGLTDWNTLRRMQGHTDIPLNDEGRQQAKSLQEYFKINPIDLFATSDLLRAQQTAQIANAELTRPCLISADFREVYLGELEGMTQSEVQEKYGPESWELWTSLDPANAHFSYPRAESSLAAVNRFERGLKTFCLENNFESAGICTHGFIMRRFLHFLKPQLKEPLPIPNCVVYKIQWHEETKEFSFSI